MLVQSYHYCYLLQLPSSNLSTYATSMLDSRKFMAIEKEILLVGPMVRVFGLSSNPKIFNLSHHLKLEPKNNEDLFLT